MSSSISKLVCPLWLVPKGSPHRQKDCCACCCWHWYASWTTHARHFNSWLNMFVYMVYTTMPVFQSQPCVAITHCFDASDVMITFAERYLFLKVLLPPFSPELWTRVCQSVAPVLCFSLKMPGLLLATKLAKCTVVERAL